MSIRSLALIAVFTALICICSMLTIPGIVPFTMQTFAVFLSIGLLGGKRGIVAICCYLLLGAVGAPVFSGFNGGLAYLISPTAGFLHGFLLMGAEMWIFENLCNKKKHFYILSMSLGLLLCYLWGSIWFCIVTDASALYAITACILPFIIPDALKLVIAYYLINKLKAIPYVNNIITKK